MEFAVNRPMAVFFMDQCIGSYNGHMASIPNNPIIDCICKAHGVTSKGDFAKFLREVSDQLANDSID